eukprot:gene18093-23742_t
MVSGVGSASLIWVQDLLWWWKSYDSSISYIGLTASQLQSCDLSSYPNLRVYINPGGDAYNQLSSLGTKGTANIKAFVQRDQTNPSAYVGFCAGGYIAAHDYLWETMYEGPGYYNYASNPPLSLFPHTVEGSIFDINDDQFGDQYNSKFRLVNVSNGHQMLYYGGSTFGYNGVEDYTNPSSSHYDSKIEVLVYYSDFYGYNSVNIPAVWKYGNVLLTSVHPEADNCTTKQDSDCPAEGTISTENILQNRAWLCTYVNTVSNSSFAVPSVSLSPIFNTTAPHTDYPAKECYNQGTSTVLFCDDFDVSNRVPEGLSPQFQRNQTDYSHARPWNVTYIDSWLNIKYTSAYSGNGYAVSVPQSTPTYVSSIITKSFDTSVCSSSNVLVSYAYTGSTPTNGYYLTQYSVNGGVTWSTLVNKVLYPAYTSWTMQSSTIPSSYSKSMQIKFTCATGTSANYYCALDSLSIACA